ncbi:MAG: leucyl/phenylalanyl-tRNA--protein transferase [Alphaproteobacteria bacterium]|nr:leucyl/phenylalanyl-tRNA--protein transferase [Alphaproteobacteria bacterium]
MADHREDAEVGWVDPERRGILPLDRFHVPRRLARTMRKSTFTVTVDRAFEQVISLCAEQVQDRPVTWINHAIEASYVALFKAGHAHSVEVWDGEELVGGLYGPSIGGAFFGESMFSRATDASKIALVHLVARLRVGGYRLLDTQFITAHLAQFGAVEISRAAYRRLLKPAVRAKADFYVLGGTGDVLAAGAVLQLTTQTS